VDHNKLNLAATKEGLGVLRIVITIINVMTAKPLVFDNTMMHTEAKQILPSIVYPIYCFPWIEIEDGMLAWDGSLLSNTLIREVLCVSLKNDKNIFIIKIILGRSHTCFLTSRKLKQGKDILFSDKNENAIQM